jgi:hypothetical protein
MTAHTRHVLHGVAVLTAATTLVAAMTGAARAAEAPSNDQLADATPISLDWSGSADLATATTEDGEPLSACSNIGFTVWYALTVDQDAVVELDTAGSETDTMFVVWSDPALHDPYVCANDDDGVLQARAAFVARAGTTYLVQVGVDGEKGAEPDQLHLAVREAAKPTGKPETFGSRDANLAAGAFWSLPMDDKEEYHIAQLDVGEGWARQSSGTPVRTAGVQLQSRRLTIADGLRYSDEWFGSAALTQNPLNDGLRGGSVDVQVDLERYRCISTSPEDVESDCFELPGETVRVRASWTGSGTVERSLLTLSDRGFGYHTTGTRQLAWRPAEVSASITGDTELNLSGRAAAVLVRDAIRTSSWWR